MSDVKRAAGAHYETMSVREICELCESYPNVIAGHQIAKSAFLWLWVTNAFLLDGSGAEVCRAWGFEPRQVITWVKGRVVDGGMKPQIGMGHFARNCTEHMILATRGRAKERIKDRGVPNVFLAPRSSHSTKPDEAYALIERLTPGPYLELFARKPRAGWQVHGNDPALKAAVA